MSRLQSLHARTGEDASQFDDVEVALFIFDHPDLDAPVRISTDNTHIVEHAEHGPVYGTFSTWQTTDGSPFLFISIAALLPGDDEEAPPAAQIVVENISSKITQVLHSISGRASVKMALVYASNPDFVEREWHGMKLVEASGDAGLITLDISSDFIGDEPNPSQRQTKYRFPGMHP